MTTTYNLLYGGIRPNDIQPDAKFLQWKVLSLDVDCLEGRLQERNGNAWAINISTDRGRAQLCMTGQQNAETQGTDVLVFKSIILDAARVIHRETFTCLNGSLTVWKLLDLIFDDCLYNYKMSQDADGLARGYRHHLQLMLRSFQDAGFISQRSDSGNEIEDFLPYIHDIGHDRSLGPSREETYLVQGTLLQ